MWTFIYWEMATHHANKTFKRPGVLHFLNMADVSRLLSLGLRVVQLPWSATQTNLFLLIQVISLT